MSVFEAFFGGLGAFFSIWIFCLFQIIPFFLVYIVAAALAGGPEGTPREIAVEAAKSIGLTLAGFSIIFVSMGMPTTAVSGALFSNLKLANQFGGVVVALLGLYFVGVLTVEKSWRWFGPLKTAFGALFGASLALAYKPCVTPTLTKIYAISGSAETAGKGGALLFFYTLGAFAAMSLVAAILLGGAARIKGAAARAGVVKGCGALLLVFSFLILSGNMTRYKSFLVGRFVPQTAGHDHSGGMKDMKGMKGGGMMSPDHSEHMGH